jgi:hypothetical protein
VPFPGDNFVAVALRHINEPPPSVRARRPDVSPRLDAAVRRAMAKDPRERFASMEDFCNELNTCLADPGTADPAAETMVVAPQRGPRRRRREPRRPEERPSVWPLIMLLAGLAVLAGILAAVFTFTDSTQKIASLAHRAGVPGGGAAPTKPVQLSAVTAFDPYGDQQEHDSSASLATDGDQATAWSTEHYLSFTKPGVGLVLDAGSALKVTKLTLSTDTPGFTAQIQSGSSQSGPFTRVSGPKPAAGTTQFTLNGTPAQYYVIWITDLGPNDHVDINEVSARGPSR